MNLKPLGDRVIVKRDELKPRPRLHRFERSGKDRHCSCIRTTFRFQGRRPCVYGKFGGTEVTIEGE